MPKSNRHQSNRILKAIAMCYVVLIIPATLVYGGMRLFTDLRGKALFNSFFPIALVLLILYIYYLIHPLWKNHRDDEDSVNGSHASRASGDHSSESQKTHRS